MTTHYSKYQQNMLENPIFETILLERNKRFEIMNTEGYKD